MGDSMDRREGWITMKKANMLVAFLGGVIALGFTVFGSVHIAVREVVHREMELQISTPTSDLNRHLEQVHVSRCALDRSDVTVRLRAVEQELAILKAHEEAQTEEIRELRADVKELLRRGRP